MDNWRIILYDIVRNISLSTGIERYSTWNNQADNDTNDAHLGISNAFYELESAENIQIFGATSDDKIFEWTIKFNVHILLKNSGVNEEKQKTAFNLAHKLSEEMMRYSGPEFLQFKRMPENQDVNHSGKLTYPLKFETSCITVEPQKRLEKVKIITINNNIEINV